MNNEKRSVVKQLVDMGFDEGKAKEAIKKYRSFEDALCNLLLEGDTSPEIKISGRRSETTPKIPVSPYIVNQDSFSASANSQSKEVNVKEEKRKLKKAVREVDKDIKSLKLEKEKIMRLIKSYEKDKISIKKLRLNLEWTDKKIQELEKNKKKMERISEKFSTMKTLEIESRTFKTMTKVMKNINSVNDSQEFLDIVKKYEIESERMDHVNDIIRDSIEDIDHSDIEEEGKAAIDQILSEVGLEIADEFETPVQKAPKKPSAQTPALLIKQGIKKLGLDKEYAKVLTRHHTFERSYMGLIHEISYRRENSIPSSLSIKRAKVPGTKVIMESSVASPIYESVRMTPPQWNNEKIVKKEPERKVQVRETETIHVNSGGGTQLLARRPEPAPVEYDEDEFEEPPDDIDEGDVSRRTPTNEGIIDVLKEAYRAKGLSDNTISSLPCSDYSSDLNSNQSTCVICLEDFEEGDEIMTVPCEHIYHSGCMKKWLEASKKCPLCNVKISD